MWTNDHVGGAKTRVQSEIGALKCAYSSGAATSQSMLFDVEEEADEAEEKTDQVEEQEEVSRLEETSVRS